DLAFDPTFDRLIDVRGLACLGYCHVTTPFCALGRFPTGQLPHDNVTASRPRRAFPRRQGGWNFIAYQLLRHIDAPPVQSLTSQDQVTPPIPPPQAGIKGGPNFSG